MDYAGIPDSYGISRQTLKSALLNMRVADGTGWSLGDAMDPDITGAAICALSPYTGDQAVAAAVAKAVASLSGKVNESGYVAGHYGISSETNAFVILGLLSAGVNPEGISTLSDGTVVNFGKSKGDLVSAMLSFKSEGGMFRHTLDGGSNSIATEQCLRALIAIKEFKESGKAYNYYSSGIKAENLKVYSAPPAESTEAPAGNAGAEEQQPVTQTAPAGAVSRQPQGETTSSGKLKTAGSPEETEGSESAQAATAAAASAETADVTAEVTDVAGESPAEETKDAESSKKDIYMTLGGGLVATGVIGGVFFLILGRKEGLN